MTTGEDGEVLREKLIDWLNAFKADPFSTGADKVDRLLALIEPVMEENERFKVALQRIETGECVTDWADQPHEQMQDEARAALSPSEKQDG
jgi:hypothetical protein